MNKIYWNTRIHSIAAFSFFFAYILSFLFEGQVLYGIINKYGLQSNQYIIFAIISIFVGLFSSGYLIRSHSMAKYTLIGAMIACLIFTLPFFFAPSVFWLVALVFAGYISGFALAAWGYYLKIFTLKNERLKSCADVLIFSNIIMIVINFIAGSGFIFVGLTLSMVCLIISILLILLLAIGPDQDKVQKDGNKLPVNLKRPMLVLFVFVSVITINSGLMYQVTNPAFGHLTWLVRWYWALPYIAALVFMRNFPLKANRPIFLYVGMGMIMAAFLAFMLLGQSAVDYIIVDTLMLGAFGIFDLFWWSIIAEMLDYTQRPAKVFGIGLSANVFGVLLGGVIGMSMTSANLSEAEVTVLALTVVSVTLVILPLLNSQLIILLKSHAYLTAYHGMDERQQEKIILQAKMLDPLTDREQGVLQLILTGKSNKEIAASLFITESTVKTHAHNIYSKYDVASRAELISSLLKNQANT